MSLRLFGGATVVSVAFDLHVVLFSFSGMVELYFDLKGLLVVAVVVLY